jgi:multidrug resistance protein, MATE family
MFVCQLALTSWLSYFRQFETFRVWEWPQRASFRELFRVGGPIGVSLLMEGGMFSAVSLLMGRLGATVMAGHQVALNIASVTFMVPLGIAMAITVRVGQAMGRGDVLAARRSGLTGAGLAMIFMACMALLMLTVPHLIVELYTPDAEVRRIGAGLLVMAAIFQIFDGMQVAGAGALRGLKDTTVPMVMTSVAYWGLGFPLAYWLGIVRQGGPSGLWSGLIAGLVIAAFLLNLRFHRVTSLLAARRGPEPVAQTMPIVATNGDFGGFQSEANASCADSEPVHSAS